MVSTIFSAVILSLSAKSFIYFKKELLPLKNSSATKNIQTKGRFSILRCSIKTAIFQVRRRV